MQTVWKGVISFGLVSIPVQLFTATEEHGVSFRQIHVSDGGQIRYRRVCTLDGEEVPYEDIARGYELPDGQVVVLTEEDFAELPLASSRAIEVLSFADSTGEIDEDQLIESVDEISGKPRPMPVIAARKPFEDPTEEVREDAIEIDGTAEVSADDIEAIVEQNSAQNSVAPPAEGVKDPANAGEKPPPGEGKP